MKKRILVVDDEPSFTRMVRLNLEKTGRYEVKEENHASHAAATAHAFQPDLVLLDVMMPGADGGDVATKIQSDPQLKDVPIVFITALVAKEEAGAKGQVRGGLLFLSKPVSLEGLLTTIESWLGKPAPSA